MSVQHGWPLRLLRTVQFGVARLASRDGYVEARAVPFDLRFTGPAADAITRHIYRYGAHEPHIARYLLEHVRLGPEDIAFDIGANLGWYSVLLQRLSEPGARIFSFEPDPETFRLLSANLRANDADRVTAMNVALGEKPGVAELHRYKDSNNGRHTLLAGDNGGGTVRVAVTTLRDLWQSEHLGARPIRFLKIDVEGFEYFVLRGAGELLSRCACVLMEYTPTSLELAGVKASDLIGLLEAAGLQARAFIGGAPRPMSFSEFAQAQTQHELLLTPRASA